MGRSRNAELKSMFATTVPPLMGCGDNPEELEATLLYIDAPDVVDVTPLVPDAVFALTGTIAVNGIAVYAAC